LQYAHAKAISTINFVRHPLLHRCPPTFAGNAQIKIEQLSAIVRKVQGESEYVLKQAAASVEKQERLAAQLAKLSKSLEQTEERIRRSQLEGKVRMHRRCA
jgi:hypothetical protein